MSRVLKGRGIVFLLIILLLTGFCPALAQNTMAEETAGDYELPEDFFHNVELLEESWDDDEIYLCEDSDTASKRLEDLFTTIDLMDATIPELQSEMEAGHVTSAELVQMYIDRINAYDEKLKLNSIISINPNAIYDAEALDIERSEGYVRGPLHGIPIVVKANYDVAGMATSAGSLAFADMIAPEDATVVRKLKEAGAVILAQANMSEFAISAADSRSTLGGFVHNAYDGTKTPAGSSGGTAVAVTCNFAAAGLGTDTGGSIRNPSSFSNLYGIRPSKGLTSIHGVLPLMASRDTTGPMARTAEDLALILQEMAGSDPLDDFTLEADADALLGAGYSDCLYADALKGKRIGYLKSSFSYEVMGEDEEWTEKEPDEKVEAMLTKARANLRKAGATFVDLSAYITPEMVQSYYFAASEASSEYDLNKYLYEKGDAAPYKTLRDLLLSGKYIMFSNLEESPTNMASSFEETVNPYTEAFGDYMRGSMWQKALDGRAEVSRILEEQNIDAIMYLSYYSPVPNEPVTDNWDPSGSSYDYVFGPALGLPEISIPMGFSDADATYTSEMPLGLNLFAGYGKEATLMEIAYAYEQQAGSYIRRMPERTPALLDEGLNAFLEDLMDQVYSIDYSLYKEKPEGKVQLMYQAYEQAGDVNTDDPYATYVATKRLARAYDRVITALEESGPAPVDLKKITLPSTAEVGTKKTVQLDAALEPADTTQKEITWKSSNTNVATVDENGKVTGVARGTATITAMSAANSKVKATCKVTVLFSDAMHSNVSDEMFRAIYWAADKKITGNTDKFGTNSSMTRGQFVRFLYRYAGQEGKYQLPAKYKKSSPFMDVKTSHTHYKAIVWAVEKGLISGYSGNVFKPERTLTRNNVATILWKFAGSPKVTNASRPFSDVAKSKALAWGKGKKLFTAVDGGMFYPKKNCLRGDFAVFLYRYDKYVMGNK